ncbi:MAG TPA: hypothetical protein ENL42_04625, partial [Thermoplasmatales archaeon]|nr:hypothetical protein [Thermoplasmatales archaeon]
PSEWRDELQPLKEHKEARGIKTIIVGLDEIYGGKYFAAEGRDDAEKIKYFIKNAIEEWGIEYVMLVGDADKMPVRYVYTSIEDLPYVPCDLYYADIYSVGNIFSSWDDDGDGVYGERGEDDVDLFPDIYIGRLPASDEHDLQILIDKIIDYKTPPMKALLVGVELFWETDIREGEYLKEKIREEINSIEAVRLYETDEYEKDGDATAEEIASYINEGMMFVNFASHGYPEGMGWEGGWWSVYDLNLLRNSYLPIIFAMSCSTNEFDTTDCLGEEFLLYENGGAIAYAGSSRIAYVYTGKSIVSSLSGYLDKAFFKSYYDGSLSVGEMFSTSKIAYLMNIPFMGTHDVLTITEYNIMGDPSIMLPPPPLTSKAHASKEVSNDPIKIWVNATEENCTIELYYRKKVLFGGKWQLYGSKNAPPYEWEFMPDEEGYYEFYSILKKGNYTENPPEIADTYCVFGIAPPSINITKPQKGKIYLFNKEVASLPIRSAIVIGKVDVEAKGDAEYMELYMDDEMVLAKEGNEISWGIDGMLFGKHTIKAVAYNIAGEEVSKEVNIWAIIL